MPPRETRSGTSTPRGVGGPDYAAPTPLGQIPVGPVYTLTDLAELAARLGSINTADRRGYVIWLDDFESIVLNKWSTMAIGGGGVTISTTAARNGAQSIKLTTGAVIDARTYIMHYGPCTNPLKLGFEASFAFGALAVEYLAFALELYDGVNWMMGSIRYYPGTNVLEIHEPAGWMVLATVDLDTTPYTFHTIKIVIDPETLKYCRILVDGVIYDVSTRDIESSASVIVPRVGLLAWAYTGVAIAKDVYIDDVILTQNEPDNLP